MKNEIAKIFSLLFNRNINVDDDFSMDNQNDWDSMKHIEIIMTLEEELDISFDAADIPQLTSMQKIIHKVEELKS